MFKYIMSLSAVLILTPFIFISVGHSLGVAGYRLDGTYDLSIKNRSVPAKVTILDCGTGAMRSVKNYAVKCEIKQKGILRNTQTYKSKILQQYAPRYRATTKPPVAKSTKKKLSIEAEKAKFWRDRAEWKSLLEGSKIEQAKQARIKEERARIDALEQIWWVEQFNKMFK